jgi:hypothetical protein
MERASGRRCAARRACANNDGDRQTDQRGLSDRGLDPTHQHHDPGTRHDNAAAAIGNARSECVGAVTKATGGRQCPGRGQKTASAETSAHAGAGSDRARGTCCVRAGGIERLTLENCGFWFDFAISIAKNAGANVKCAYHHSLAFKIMPLHLIKLAVGCESVKELKGWVAERMKTAKKRGLPQRHVHITRMTPKRVDEILVGGSLYWVIRGEIAAREKIVAIEPFRDKDGIGRCRLVMQPKVITVSPRPMRAFQGWRYFTEDAAPPDLTRAAAGSIATMPEPLRRELRNLGLL